MAGFILSESQSELFTFSVSDARCNPDQRLAGETQSQQGHRVWTLPTDNNTASVIACPVAWLLKKEKKWAMHAAPCDFN